MLNENQLVANLLWSSLSLIPLSAIVLFINRKDVDLFKRDYWLFITERWKLITFAISGGFITFVGPYTSDPTWDRTNAGLMSLFTYLTAPWSLGILFQIAQRKKKIVFIFPIITFWLLSVVWSYDIYLFIRDGYFPEASIENFILSGLLYFSAGLFWNLEESESGKITLGFLDVNWPKKKKSRFSKIFWIALPLMLLAIYLTVPLLIEGLL